jgi:hypothetical protein
VERTIVVAVVAVAFGRTIVVATGIETGFGLDDVVEIAGDDERGLVVDSYYYNNLDCHRYYSNSTLDDGGCYLSNNSVDGFDFGVVDSYEKLDTATSIGVLDKNSSEKRGFGGFGIDNVLDQRERTYSCRYFDIADFSWKRCPVDGLHQSHQAHSERQWKRSAYFGVLGCTESAVFEDDAVLGCLYHFAIPLVL